MVRKFLNGEVIYLQHLLIEYLEKYNFLKTADVNSIFADVKPIIQLLCLYFFANMKQIELERLLLITSAQKEISIDY